MSRTYKVLEKGVRRINASTLIEKQLPRLHNALGAFAVQFIEGLIEYPSRGAGRNEDLRLIAHLREGGRPIGRTGTTEIGTAGQTLAQDRSVIPALGISAAKETARK